MGQRFERQVGPFWVSGTLPDAFCGPGFGSARHQHRPGPGSWTRATWDQSGPGHRHGGHHGGPPPWLAGLFGMGGPERGRGPRARRGDVRAAILDVLAHQGEDAGEGPNGYQVIQQITERSGGAWKPSPGSVYPTIQQLEDEGLVVSGDERGRRSLRLTEAGTAYCAENAADFEAVWAPFRTPADDDGAPSQNADLKAEIGQVMGAVWQIVTNGDDSQRRAAVQVLVEARRALYGILADGPDQVAADE